MSTGEEIGYGKPPRNKRFRKGQSGNPRGRPPGRQKKPPYEAVLGQMVTVREDGIERRVTAAEAFVLYLTKRALDGDSAACPSYKFRPAQKSGPFRVVPDSVCDPHTILLHGVLSIFRNRAMRQLEIIAPRHQLDVLRRSSEACGRDTQNTRVSAPDGVYRRDTRRYAAVLVNPHQETGDASKKRNHRRPDRRGI